MGQKIKVPWGAWVKPEYLELEFPESWKLEEFKMKFWDKSALSREDIKQSIKNPIGTPRLSELAREKKSVVIVSDDMTRTTPVAEIIPFVLEELEASGIEKENITFLLAIGGHKPMNRNECIKKLGKEVVDNYNIENHHPYENLTNLGTSSNGTPIEVNSTYYNADLKISIGGVIPHPLAGFGGGAKIILPGVSGINTLAANHSAPMEGRLTAGIGTITGIREDIEEIVDKIGLDFSINILFNEVGEIASLTAGDFREAHRKLILIAKEAYSTPISLEKDICFLNSFPEDSELNQCVKALNFLMISPSKLIKRKGAIVIMTYSYEGRGFHSLIGETGAKLYKNFGESGLIRAFVKRRTLYVFSPNVSKPDLNHYFPESTLLFNDWDNLIDAIVAEMGENLDVGIIPTSIQLTEQTSK